MTFLLSLLGFARTLREWATIAFRWALTPLWHVLVLTTALALAWGAIERHGRLKVAKVLASTEQAYRTAQADAKAAQDALNAANVATNEAINKGSTDANTKGLDAARTAVADYARMHPAPRCAASETNSAAVSDPARLAAGASGETGVVAVTVADLDTLAAGTVRAESCRAWGQSMIEAGLAIAGD